MCLCLCVCVCVCVRVSVCECVIIALLYSFHTLQLSFITSFTTNIGSNAHRLYFPTHISSLSPHTHTLKWAYHRHNICMRRFNYPAHPTTVGIQKLRRNDEVNTIWAGQQDPFLKCSQWYMKLRRWRYKTVSHTPGNRVCSVESRSLRDCGSARACQYSTNIADWTMSCEHLSAVAEDGAPVFRVCWVT